MGYEYIVLDLNKLKLLTKWNKTIIFNSKIDIQKYCYKKIIASFRIIKL